MESRLGMIGLRNFWRRHGVALIGIVALEALTAAVDRSVPQEVPTSHLYYAPIILAAATYGYLGGGFLAVASLVLFALANYVWNTAQAPELFLPAAALTFVYYLAVGLAAAAFFARQRQILDLGARLRRRVAQLDALNRVAVTAAASDALDLTLRTILAGVRILGDAPYAGIVWLSDRPGVPEPVGALSDADPDAPRANPFGARLLQRVVADGQSLELCEGDPSLGTSWNSLLALPLVVGGTIVGVLSVADIRPRALTAEERQPLETLAQQAAEAIARSRLRARELDLAVSDERNRLAREIHDTLAQSLLAIILQLEAAAAHLPADPGRAGDELRRASATARDALGEARRSVRGLRPAVLARHSLIEALSAEATACGDAVGAAARFEIAGDPGSLVAPLEDALFGVAREALNNVRKHAQPRSLDVVLAFTADTVTLTVRDDGAGFDPNAVPGEVSGRFGLIGMRERVRLLGGDFTITATTGQGTMIRATVPLQSPIPDESRPVRVLLCDDHALVRRGVAEALLTDATIAVVGEAGSGAEALARAALVRPDVVLLDLRLPDLDGVEVTRRLNAARPGMPILILTSFGDDPALLDAIRAGARGCLLKDLAPEQLVAAIHAAARGEPVLAPAVADRLIADWRLPTDQMRPATEVTLSPRESEVLLLAARGARNKEIAQALGITERTAKAHIRHVMDKLGVGDRTAAVAVGLQRGLIRP